MRVALDPMTRVALYSHRSAPAAKSLRITRRVAHFCAVRKSGAFSEMGRADAITPHRKAA